MDLTGKMVCRGRCSVRRSGRSEQSDVTGHLVRTMRRRRHDSTLIGGRGQPFSLFCRFENF